MKNQIREPRSTGNKNVHRYTVRPLGRRLAALAAAVLILSGLAFYTSAMAEDGHISIEIQYGYDNIAKGGRQLPVDVTMENEGGEDFEGTLQVKSVESDATVYRYDYQVDIPAGETQQQRYYIPLGTEARQLLFTLTDEMGSQLAEQLVELNVSRDVPELFVGILSDYPEQLTYLNGIGINYSTLRTRSIALDKTDFPKEQLGLNLLDVLVVNSYKLRNLSEEQTGAIMDWVHSGGVLILGTGARVDDTLGRFAPELLDDSYGEWEQRQINLGEEFGWNEPGEGILTIPCVDIPLHGGNVILSSSGFPLLTAVAKEQGIIAATAFDMGDIAAVCENNAAYVDYFFTSLLGESRINRLAELAYSGNSGKFWSVQTLINTGDLDKLPHLLAYGAVVALYLLLLGPGLYLFLKNRDLQVYYRRGVLVLALTFAGVIYVMGMETRFRSTFYTYAAIQDVTKDFVMDTEYVNVRSPYNRPYKVELDPAYSVLPITQVDFWRNKDGVALSDDPDYQVAITRTDEATVIRGQNIPAFNPRYFKLEKKSENSENVGITGEIDYFEGKISGTLKNDFPFPIENTTIILYGNMLQVGRMEPGEEKRLEDFELLRYPLGNTYVVADWVSGESAFKAADIDNKVYLLAMERSNLLKFYLDNYMSGYTADARVVAFSTEKEESQFLLSNSPETYGLTMLTAALEVNASRDRSLYRSVLMKTPRVISGSYDETTNSMGGLEPLTLEYQLGTDIEVESLTFESVHEAFFKSRGSSFTEVFDGSIYFYNHETGNYDQMELEGKTMEVEELRPYLSSGNTITVRYVYGGASGYNAIQLPMPMVAGREK